MQVTKSVVNSVIAFFLFAIVSVDSIASPTEVKGSVTVEYSKNMNVVIRSAKIKALGLYSASFDGAMIKQYMLVESEFISDIDRYVPELRIIEEEVDRPSKIINLAIRAKINDVAIRAKLSSLSAAGSSSSGEGSLFTFIFVGRQAVSAKTKDIKRVSIAQVESASTNSNDAAVAGLSVTESSESNAVVKLTSGGASTKSATIREYQVISSQDINAAMGNVLSTAGFEVTDYDDVVDACGGVDREIISEEFGTGDDMSRESRGSAVNASRDCDVSLFATGTIDVGVQDIDPVSGNSRVYVSVRAQVWNIEKRLPKKVASVGPIQYAGLGPDDQVAMRNALTLAAKEAGQEIVNQLNAKNIY